MNQQLAAAAIIGVTDPHTESAKGYCSRFVRQVVEKLYPGKYAALFAESANQTGLNFLDAGLGFPADGQAVQPGDILVKEFAPFGHIGIAVPNHEAGTPALRVAENSSTRIGRVLGAKGYRPLAIWGHVNIVARLPETAPAEPPAYKLIIAGSVIASMPMRGGKALCPIRAFADALGIPVELDEDTGHIILGGKEMDEKPTLINGRGYAPVRDIAALTGHALNVDTADRNAYVS